MCVSRWESEEPRGCRLSPGEVDARALHDETAARHHRDAAVLELARAVPREAAGRHLLRQARRVWGARSTCERGPTTTRARARDGRGAPRAPKKPTGGSTPGMSSTAMERVVAPERDAAFGSGDDGTNADAEARRARAATTRAIVLLEGAHRT